MPLGKKCGSSVSEGLTWTLYRRGFVRVYLRNQLIDSGIVAVSHYWCQGTTSDSHTTFYLLLAQAVSVAGSASGAATSNLCCPPLHFEWLFFLGSERRLDAEQFRDSEQLLGLFYRFGTRVGISTGAFVADHYQSRIFK
ncbi:hypothetical protein MRX96_050083 [Rhipicephalus microplus]